MEAVFIKKMVEGFVGDARLYKVSPPVRYEDSTTEYVIVSGINAMFSGEETYIFPATKDGEILDWMELNGSFQGEINHRRALENAGYTVTGEGDDTH